MTISASPDPPSKSEPDLFFPVSDDEEGDEPEPVTTATVASDARQPLPLISSWGESETKPHHDKSDASAPLLGSQNSDIIPLSPPRSDLHDPSRVAGPSRKRSSASRSPSPQVPASFTGGYLGEFVCEGWSLSKGRGYCVSGSKVIFERPKPAKAQAADEAKVIARSKEKVGPAKLVNGKVVNAKAKPGGGKQVTLGALGVGKKGAMSAVDMPFSWRESQT